jgi:hypothetical protein
MHWYDPDTRQVAEFFDKLGAEQSLSREEIHSKFVEHVYAMKEAQRTKSDSTPKGDSK